MSFPGLPERLTKPIPIQTYPYDGSQAYSRSKGALRELTWARAGQFRGTGVVVNASAPGFVRADLNRHTRRSSATLINLAARMFVQPGTGGLDTPSG